MKNIKQDKLKKGTSLIELLVVMAIVAVIGVVISSFTLSVNARQAVEGSRYQLLEAQTQAENYLNNFLENFDREDYIFYTDGERLWAIERSEESNPDAKKYYAKISSINKSEYYAILSTDRTSLLWDENGEDQTLSTQLDFIEKISFTIENKTETIDVQVVAVKQLIICRLFYYIPDSSNHNKNISGSYVITYTTKAN